jgi:hypothetical protein
MAITIGSNISSLQAQRRLAGSSEALNSTFLKLSSGQRINKASDDAAGLAIADALKANIRVGQVAVRNANDGISSMHLWLISETYCPVSLSWLSSLPTERSPLRSVQLCRTSSLRSAPKSNVSRRRRSSTASSCSRGTTTSYFRLDSTLNRPRRLRSTECKARWHP